MGDIVAAGKFVPDGYVNLLEACGGQPDLARLYLYRLKLMLEEDVVDKGNVICRVEDCNFLRVDVVSSEMAKNSKSKVELALLRAEEPTFWGIEHDALLDLAAGKNNLVKLYERESLIDKLKIISSDFEFEEIADFDSASNKTENFYIAVKTLANGDFGKNLNSRLSTNKEFSSAKAFLGALFIAEDVLGKVRAYTCDQVLRWEVKPVLAKADSEFVYKFKINSFASKQHDVVSEFVALFFQINKNKIAGEFVVLALIALFKIRVEVESIYNGSKQAVWFDKNQKPHDDDSARKDWINILLEGLSDVDIFKGARPVNCELEVWCEAKSSLDRLKKSGLLDLLSWHFFSRRYGVGENRHSTASCRRLSFIEAEDLAGSALKRAQMFSEDDPKQINRMSDLLDEDSVLHHLMLGIEAVSEQILESPKRRKFTKAQIEGRLDQELTEQKTLLPKTTFLDKIYKPMAEIILEWHEEL